MPNEPRRTRSGRESGAPTGRRGTPQARAPEPERDSAETRESGRSKDRLEGDLITVFREFMERDRHRYTREIERNGEMVRAIQERSGEMVKAIQERNGEVMKALQEAKERRGIVAMEDGKNMRTFLSVVERELKELGKPMETWGDELRKYLTGDALAHWQHMHSTGIDMTNWEDVQQDLKGRFCALPREKMIEQMIHNTWKGSHTEYASRFGAIAAQGETLPSEDLVGCFLHNLPDNVYEEVTQRGKSRKQRQR